MKKEDELNLEVGDLVVYPIYGVGEVENFDSYEVDGSSQDFILINWGHSSVGRAPLLKVPF